MTDEEFENACAEIAALADKIAGGTPEQIEECADAGWWDAMNTLNGVYNEWLRAAA